MRKFAVNYGRSFPDHRVGMDHVLEKEIGGSLIKYFRVRLW
jgi:hypothetical protein